MLSSILGCPTYERIWTFSNFERKEKTRECEPFSNHHFYVIVNVSPSSNDVVVLFIVYNNLWKNIECNVGRTIYLFWMTRNSSIKRSYYIVVIFVWEVGVGIMEILPMPVFILLHSEHNGGALMSQKVRIDIKLPFLICCECVVT